MADASFTPDGCAQGVQVHMALLVSLGGRRRVLSGRQSRPSDSGHRGSDRRVPSPVPVAEEVQDTNRNHMEEEPEKEPPDSAPPSLSGHGHAHDRAHHIEN